MAKSRPSVVYGPAGGRLRAVRSSAMRSRIHAVVLGTEAGEFTDEIGQVFADLGRTLGAEGLVGECSPPVDVFETDDALEVTVDLPAVDPAAVRVVIKKDALLVIGEKASRRARRDSSFHLVERGFGRFARIVRFALPCDAARARATMADGELRVTLPEDRRPARPRVPRADRTAPDAHSVHRRHRRAPGARSGPARPGGDRRPARDRSGRRQRRECRGRIRHHARDRRAAARLRAST